MAVGGPLAGPTAANFTPAGFVYEITEDFSTDLGNAGDPDDDDDTPESQPAADRHLGQIQSYSPLVFDKQHRTHHFTVLFFGDMARIIRWDRSGTVVTEKFNYKTDSAIRITHVPTGIVVALGGPQPGLFVSPTAELLAVGR